MKLLNWCRSWSFRKTVASDRRLPKSFLPQAFCTPYLEILESRNLPSTASAASSSILDAYNQNPLSFEPNAGQTAAQVQFLSRGQGYALYLTPDEAVLSLQQSSGTTSPTAAASALPTPAVLTMQLVSANATAGGTGLDKLASTTNYLGATQATSLTDLPNYGQVEYQNVYAGINLIYFGNQQQLEFNFVVAPGADPHAVALQFQGADSITLDSAGDLVLHTAGGNVVENAPVVYQMIGGVKQTVSGAYVMQGTSQVGFQLGTYDHSQPLVIDPVVVYSTYLGGSDNDVGSGITVDSSGNTYVAGWTNSLNFATTSGSLQPTLSFSDASTRETFVTRFDPSGKIAAATYLGGQAYSTIPEIPYNAATSIAVDKAGDVYLAGYSQYSGYGTAPFPTTLTPFPSSEGSGVSLIGTFVAELDPKLDQLLYSTYIGTSGTFDEGAGIAVDTAGDAYVAGTNYGGSRGSTYVYSHGMNLDIPFLAKLDLKGNLIFKESINASSVTTLDPTASDYGNYATGVTLDAAGNAYVVGSTDSNSFGTPVLPQVSNPGGYDAFVWKVLPNGQQSYLAQVGGSQSSLGNTDGDNYGNAIAVDAAGDAYVTGSTDATNFPTVNPLQTTKHAGEGGSNAFVFKLNPAGTQLLYSTYLGGSGGASTEFAGPAIRGNDYGSGIAVDSAGDAYVVGSTNSLDFPTKNALQPAFGQGGVDAFVSELDPKGSSLLYSTFYAGSGADASHTLQLDVYDQANAIAVDQFGNAYITGLTTSADFPTQNAAQSTFGGGTRGETSAIDAGDVQYPPDAFVVKIVVPRPPVVTGLPISTSEGSTFSGPVATFTDNVVALMSTDFTATINWGDGTSSSGSITPSGAPDNHFIIRATHIKYVAAGSYIVTVTVHDNVNNVDGTTETNLSQMPGNQTDGTVATDPTGSGRMFAASAEEGTGLFVASSGDNGVTWTGKTIAAGGADGLPTAGGQPQAAFDQFGNLYLAYVDQTGQNIVVALSTDGGQTFTTLDTFSGLATFPSGVSRPVITVGPGPNGAANIWVAFLNGTTQIDASGVDADSLGIVGVFSPLKVVVSAVFGSTLNLGGIAVGPHSQVLVSFQTQTTAAGPSAIYAGLDANGLSGSFAPALLVTSTNVGGADPIPPQQTQTVGAGASLAWDLSSKSSHMGRAYLVYTDAATPGGSNTSIYLRYSDNNGMTWSAPVAVSAGSGTTASAPAITNGPPPVGGVGTPYNFTYTVTGTPTPTFSVSLGALPDGLTLSSAGVISGTPSTPGTFSGVVTASNAVSPNAAQSFSITIYPVTGLALTITNGPPQGGTVGTPYNFTYTYSGLPTPSFSVSSGALPDGLTLSSAGVISGRPSTPGTFSGVVTPGNGGSPNATQSFSITIATASSQFLPSIAVDPSTGDVGVAWYDAGNDPNDVATQFFAAVSSNGGQSFSPNVAVGVGSSDATNANLNAYGQQNQYGDYTGLAFAGGILYPVWADNSTALEGNPDLPQFDLAEARPAVAHVADLPLTATPLNTFPQVMKEGQQFKAALATFTDPDPNSVLSDYTATIDWGDPDPNTGPDITPGTITVDSGVYTVTGTKFYMAASSYTITITIQDIGGASATVTTTAVVQDAPLFPGADVNLAARADQSWTGIVGTFTDTDPNGAPDNYSTTIHWGDQGQSKGLVVFDGSAALTFDSANDTLYTFGNNDLLTNNPPYLMGISAQGVVTPVAPVDSTFYGGLAYDPNNGTLYALSNAPDGVSTLMSYDFSTQTFSPVAVLGSGFTGGLAFDSAGNSALGNLYAIAGSGTSWELEQIAVASTALVTGGFPLLPPGNQPPISYTGLAFDNAGHGYAVGNDSDGDSTLYQVTVVPGSGSVTIIPISPLGNNLPMPPSTQEGFTGGLAYEPVGAPGNLGGGLVGISGDGSGTTYINTISPDGTAASAFEVYVPAPPGAIKPASGDFSNGFDVIATHIYLQVLTASITVTIVDVEPSQVPDSVLRSTATDGGTVTVVPPPPQALPAPPPFTAYQGYATGSLTLASFTVSGGALTTPDAYMATINWNDGSTLDTGTVVVSGPTIVVSGTHTYSQPGGFQPAIVLHDILGDAASVTDTVTVVADLTALTAPAPVTAFQNDATGILSLGSFAIPAALPGAGSGSYTATIDWGDGNPASPGTVQISGLTVTVSGSYTYLSAGAFAPVVVLDATSGGGSATVTDSLTVLADVTSLVHPVSTGPIYNPLTQLFNANVTFTNTGAKTLTGPFPLVFQGLPAGVTIADATGITGDGIPYVSDALAWLAPGQSGKVAVQFNDPQVVPITYTLQIIDPAPSNPLQLVSTIDPSLISASGAGNSGTLGFSASADGRYVAFVSQAGNLAPNPQLSSNVNSLLAGQIYVRDTQTEATTLVSQADASGQEYADPVISPDGRYLAFQNGGGNLELFDMTTGTTTYLLAYEYHDAVFSANSEYLVFDSPDNTLGSVAYATDQVYERNLQTGTTTLVSVNANGTAKGDNPSEQPSVSADGRYVAFAGFATDLTLNDAVGGQQIFVRDMQQGTTTLVSADFAGTDGGSSVASPSTSYGVSSANPLISADGSTVVFDSFDTNLLGTATPNYSLGLFARNLQSATTSLVGTIDPSLDILAYSEDLYKVALSANGQDVTFASVATNLVSTPFSHQAQGIAGFPDPVNVYVRNLQTGTTTLVSVDQAGTAGGNGGAVTPVISADGRFVLFISAATNLVSNTASGVNLFLRDTQLNSTTLVSVNDAGVGDGGTFISPPYLWELRYALSSDDNLVTFVSDSPDLVPNDNNNAADVFQRNLEAQTTTLLSSADPNQPDLAGPANLSVPPPNQNTAIGSGSNLPFVSGNGEFVAFQSTNMRLVGDVTVAKALSSGIAGIPQQVFVRDVKTQTTVLASANLEGIGGGNDNSYIVGIGADGKMVLFFSVATDLVANDTVNTHYQLFVRDLQTGTTSLVTENEANTGPGETGALDSFARLSANDRYVVFSSTSTDLVSNDEAGGNQLFVRDLQLGTTTLVSVNVAGTDGGDGNNASYGEQISADGRYVVFQSSSDNLVPDDNNSAIDVFVRDLQTGKTSLVSVNASGSASGNGASSLTADAHTTWQNGIDPFTPDGRYIVFSSYATDLVSNNNISGQNVYVRDLVNGTTTLVSVNTDGTATGPGAGNAIDPEASISADGRYVSFLSAAVSLVSPNVTSGEKVYVRDMDTSVTRLVSDGTTNSSVTYGGAVFATGSISANGQVVIFESDVMVGHELGLPRLFVSDLQRGITRQVDASLGGDDGSDMSDSGTAQLSADGNTIVFSGGYDNLLVGTFNETTNVYAYTLPMPAKVGTLLVSASPIHAVEGTSFTDVVASFTDTDGDPTGNYTASIAWNDGSTSSGTISANADGSFDVTGTHTFAEAGFYPIGITVSDTDGSTASASTTVVETSPSGDISYPIEVDTSALQGTSGSVAFQFNPGATAKAQASTASIGNFMLSGGKLTSALTTQGGVSGSLAGTVQLTNSSVLNEITQGLTFGSRLSFELTISGAAVESPSNGDFASTFAVQLLAADGVTPQATIDPSGAVNTVDVNPDGSTRVTNFASSSQGGAPVAGTPNVADAPLQANGATLIATDGTPFTGVVATFTDANPDATAADYLTPTIVWGDGQTSNGTIAAGSSGVFNVTSTDTYAEAGKYTAGVTIMDSGGSSATATVAVTVAAAALNPTGTTLNATTGTTFAGVVATFTDDNPDATLSAYLTPTIVWGDGQTSNGTIATGSSGQFVVMASHSYSASGKYPVQVNITAQGGATVVAQSMVIVNASAAPTMPVLTWANPADITYGTVLGATQLDASANVAGTFAYSPAAGTLLDAGSLQTLSATFTPADNTEPGSSVQVTINVLKATPQVSVDAVDLSAGTALADSQLDGSASADVGGKAVGVGGTLSLGALAGTVLAPGSYSEAATFTPSDATNFTSATPQVMVLVTPQVTVPVLAPPAITSADVATFTVGSSGSFTVTATGSPPLTLNESGTLPSGLTFVDNGNGTATLSGIPAVATQAVYVLTLTAANGITPSAVQTFYLRVGRLETLLGQYQQLGSWFVSQSVGDPAHSPGPAEGWAPGVTFVDVQTGDFNGDGFTDYAGRDLQTGQWFVALSNGHNQFTTTIWDTWSSSVTWTDVKVGDLTGNGKDDIIGRVLQTGQWWAAISTGTSFQTSLWDVWNPNVTWVDVQVGDVTGDHKADVVGRVLETGQWWVGVSTGYALRTSLWDVWDPTVTWVDVQLGDFNGDGKLDLVGRVLQSGDWWVGLSTGAAFVNSFWDRWSTGVTWVDVKVGDLTGDGKADIIGRALENGEWWAGVSTGAAFRTSLWDVWSTAVTWVDVQIGDFNGDGLMDINGRALENGQWWLGESTGTSLSTRLWDRWDTVPTWVNVSAGIYG